MQNSTSSYIDEREKPPAASGETNVGKILPDEAALLAPDQTSAPAHRRPGGKQITLIAGLVLILVVVSVALLPILLTPTVSLTAATRPVTSAQVVGSASFASSGQLDPNSSRGLNDVVHIALRDLPPPAPGKSEYAWLLPDSSQDEQPPVLLGVLQISSTGSAQLTYTSPTHTNLLATLSRFLVTEEAANPTPLIPSLNTSTWRSVGSVPDTAAPGDANHYSLLSHLRHLLAQDPTLQGIGLSGGLDIWLYRNAGKLLEWASAARDDWAGGQASLALMRRQIGRVIDYLDGVDYAWRDVPPDTPFLVDPKAGHIGLLNMVQGQNPPGYLAHVDLHLVGLSNSPGVTTAQKKLAEQIDAMLASATSLLRKVHDDAAALAKLSDTAILEPQALSLLDDMFTNASAAFVGQPNPATGESQGGITQIHNELQMLAFLPVNAA